MRDKGGQPLSLIIERPEVSLKSSACTVQTRSMSRASDSLAVIRILTAADSSLLLPQKWAGRTRIILSCLPGVIGGVESLGWKHSILGEKSSCANYTRRCQRGGVQQSGGSPLPAWGDVQGEENEKSNVSGNSVRRSGVGTGTICSTANGGSTCREPTFGGADVEAAFGNGCC